MMQQQIHGQGRSNERGRASNMDSQNEPAGMIGRKPSYVRSILRFLAPPKEQETVKVINDKELKVLQRGTEKIVKLDQIYGESSSSTRDFFSKEFKSSAKQCLNGSNYAFLFTGETSSDKLRLMCGDEKQAGIGDLFVDEIFSLRNDQQKPIVTMQFVSIAGDLISDLVNPKNQFHISVDMTLDGVMIQHNSDVNVRNRDDFRRSMMEGMRVLRESPEKAALRSVFVILEIRNKDLFSRVIFACLPGFERLGVDPQVLRAREGPIANMELLAFAAVLNRMAFADEGSASYCDFSMSKTTYLLEEALGGNCCTLLISSINTGARMPLKTLEIASAIRRVANYPIQNNVASNKVFQRLRRTIAYMKQRNQTVNTSSHLGSDRDAYDSKLSELEKKLIDSEIARASLIEEKKATLKKFQEFRDKFKSLTAAKVSDQKALIESEKERLRISKLLVELKINKNQSSEKTLEEKHVQEAKILELESEIAKLKSHSKLGEDSQEKIKEELKNKIDQYENLRVEFVSVKYTLIELQEQYDKVRDKNKKISAELLTLHNTNKFLQKSKEEVEKRVKASAGMNIAGRKEDKERKAAEVTKDHNDKETKALLEKYAVAKGEVDRLKKKLHDQSLEYRQKIEEGVVSGGAGEDSKASSALSFAALNAKVFHEHVRQERGSIDEIIEQQTKIDALESNISKLIKHYRILYEYLMMSSLPEEAWPAVLKEREIEQLQNATTTQASNVGVLKTLFNRLRALQESIVESNDRQVKLVEENDRLKREGHRSDGSVSTIQKLQEHLDKMFAEQVAKSSKSDRQKILDLQDEIAVLKSKNQRLEQRSQEGDPDVKRRLQEQLSQKDGEIRRMKEESMSLREKIHDLQKKAKAPKTPREKQDAKAISNQLAEFSAGQIQQLERENAELRTKLLQCETELQNCEEFMKEQITSYQNQIISLKKELAALKQTNSSQPRAAW